MPCCFRRIISFCNRIHGYIFEIHPIYKEKLRLWGGDLSTNLQSDNGIKLPCAKCVPHSTRAPLHHHYWLQYLPDHEPLDTTQLVWRRSHNSTVCKLDGLARSIEACVHEYFNDRDTGVTEEEAEASRDSIYKVCRSVMDSKSSNETHAHFASWEPRFSKNCNKYPWHLYVKLGGVLRHFGYTAAALNGCLESEIQTPRSVRSLFRDPCTRVAREVSKSLLELATSIKNRRRFSPDVLSDHLHVALQDLDTAIKSQPRLFLGSNSANKMLVSWKQEEISPRRALPSVKTDISALLSGLRHKKVPDQSKDAAGQKQLRPTLSKLAITSLEFSEALPFAAFASLLVEMVARLDLVIEQVEELGKAANFKEFSGEDDIVIDMSTKENGREIQNHHLESQVGE